MPLVALKQVSIRFRGPSLLDEVDCLIEAGQRIGLLGRNGAGKSTLFRLLTGEVEPDHGAVTVDGFVSTLQQEVPHDVVGSVGDVVRAGLQSNSEFEDWQLDHQLEKTLTQTGLHASWRFESLSAGWKRRVLLAKAIVGEPDLLLLDEPTNHLDIDSISWMESFLARWPKALMFVTHDRRFLRRLADRILEIDRGRLFDWTCDYDTFLKRKEQWLAAEEKQQAEFDRRLAEEEAWIRQGIKARRTRNEGRVRALKAMRLERQERRQKVGKTNLQIQEAGRSGNLVVHAENVTFAYPSDAVQEKPGSEARDSGTLGDSSKNIVDGCSTTIMRGDRVGIVGPNGAGKTTLIKLLLGKLKPSSGTIKLGVNLEVAYFDQLRHQLNADNTVEQEVADGYDTVKIGGQPKHVLGYLQDFLFTPERARTPIKRLSGGERNRILLAKLFAKPANLIVMDEPTNDLDAETLELLEERLAEYKGTVMVVSHDREFLNNVATQCLVFESQSLGDQETSAAGPGMRSFSIAEYVGGYDDWIEQSKARSASVDAPDNGKNPKQVTAVPKARQKEVVDSTAKRKLTFKESKELEGIPSQIEVLEQRIDDIHQTMADEAFYRQDGQQIAAKQQELQTAEAELATLYSRWEELESLNA